MAQTKKTTTRKVAEDTKKTSAKKLSPVRATKKTTAKAPKSKTAVRKVVEKATKTVAPIVEAAVDKVQETVLPVVEDIASEDIKLDDIDLSKENTLSSDDVSLQSDVSFSDDISPDMDQDVSLPNVSLGLNELSDSTSTTNDGMISQDTVNQELPTLDLSNWSDNLDINNPIADIWSQIDNQTNTVDPFDWLNIDDITSGNTTLDDIIDNNTTEVESKDTTVDSQVSSSSDVDMPIENIASDQDNATPVADPFVAPVDVVWNPISQETNISIDALSDTSTEEVIWEKSSDIQDSMILSPAIEQPVVDPTPSVTDASILATDNPTDTSSIETTNLDPDALLNQLSTQTDVVQTTTGLSKTKKMIIVWSIITWIILLAISAYVLISTFKPNEFTDDINANILGVKSWSNLLWLDINSGDTVNQVQVDPWLDQFGNPIIIDTWSTDELSWDTVTWEDNNTQEDADDVFLTPTDDFWSEDELTLDDIANIDQQPTDTTDLNNQLDDTTTDSDNNQPEDTTNTTDTTTTDTNQVGTIWATQEQISAVQEQIVTSLDEVKQLLTIAKENNNTQVMRLLAIILTKYRDLSTSIDNNTFSNFSEIETQMSEINYLLDRAKAFIIQ